MHLSGRARLLLRIGTGITLAFMYIPLVVILLYASVLVHELSHCVVARAFQLTVRRILLYPLGGFSEIEQEPPTPAKEFGVSVVGPLTSLALAGIGIGLDFHQANRGEAFDECRTGLDHLSFGVPARDELAAWVARLDELGIHHTGIRDEKEPLAYSTVVFRDPDNIQLEFIALG